MRRQGWKIAILGLLVVLVSPVVLAYFAPALFLRYYFWAERKTDSQVLRDLEPTLSGAGLLKPARVRVRGGFTMVLDPRDLVPLSLLRSEEWQTEIWDSLAAALPKGGVFLDVGAHIGYFSLKAAREVGETGKVVAFEPNPETLALLRDNVAANHMTNLVVQGIACTDREQQLTFYAAPENNTGASSLSENNATYGGAPRAFQVRGRPIDDVVREMGLTRVDAIKIDVEGAELQVLRGAAETLKRFHPKIVLEWVPSQLASFHTTTEEVAGFIRGAGYTMGSPVNPGATDWQWTMAQSVVNMADPVTAGQLLRGFGGVASRTWRWTGPAFSIALMPPEGASVQGATLVGKFVFPEVAFRHLGRIRLTARIGTTQLAAVTFDSEGEHEYRAEVPASALKGNPVEVDFSVDRTFRDNNEDLGLIAYSIGLQLSGAAR